MQPQNKQGAPNDTGVTDYGKCLETGKRQNSLNTESVWKQENDKTLEYGKCLETGKQQNPLHQQKRDSRGAPTDIEYGKCPETRK